MGKDTKINLIIKLIENELQSIGVNNFSVKNIYHENINTDFCSNYFVDAPLSSYNKNGPHIFISAGDKIGFGLYADTLSFNNGLYDLGKYWAELLSPDFIIIFSDNVRNQEFNNKLFQDNKNIILNGFKPNKNSLKKTPILISELNNSFSEFRIKYSNINLTDIFLSNKNNIGFKEDKITEDIYYVLGNTYDTKDKNILKFSNLTYINNKLLATTLNLKFFNNLREVERRLVDIFGINNVSFNLEKSDSFIYSNLEIRIKKIKKDFPDTKTLLSKPPIYTKLFIRGFLDRNFIYGSNNPYSGISYIRKEVLDDFIIDRISSLGGKVKKDQIIINNSMLESRQSPFCNGIIKII